MPNIFLLFRITRSWTSRRGVGPLFGFFPHAEVSSDWRSSSRGEPALDNPSFWQSRCVHFCRSIASCSPTECPRSPLQHDFFACPVLSGHSSCPINGVFCRCWTFPPTRDSTTFPLTTLRNFPLVSAPGKPRSFTGSKLFEPAPPPLRDTGRYCHQAPHPALLIHWFSLP